MADRAGDAPGIPGMQDLGPGGILVALWAVQLVDIGVMAWVGVAAPRGEAAWLADVPALARAAGLALVAALVALVGWRVAARQRPDVPLPPAAPRATMVAMGCGAVAALFPELAWTGPVVLVAAALAVVAATGALLAGLRELPASTWWKPLAVAVGIPWVFALGPTATGSSLAWLSLLAQRSTLFWVHLLVRLLYDDVVYVPSEYRVGTTLFEVRITEGCGGYVSLAFGAVLVAIYLTSLRRHLAFPRALWIAPLYLASMHAANVARVVALIAYGRSAPHEAWEAVHANVGWGVLAVVTLVALPLAERLTGARRDPTSGWGNPAAPYLVPMMGTLASGITLAMAGLAASPLAYARYAVGVLACAATGVSLARVVPTAVVAPALAGAAAAGIYVLGEEPEASALVRSTFGGGDGALLAIHLVGYALVTPVVEELAFRGYLARRLASARFETVRPAALGWGPILGSALLFGLVHDLSLSAAAAGALFGVAGRRTDSLGGAVLAHVVTNGLLAAYALATQRYGFVA